MQAGAAAGSSPGLADRQAIGVGAVLVMDFGAQYAQLLARRPAAVILSGGPASVYAPGAPPAPAGLFDAGIPILGICYGFQLMVRDLGGEVARTGTGEYGAA